MKNKLTGIYAIHNTENDAVYIGSSININKRIIRHKSELNNNKHPNIYLQRAYNKYGKDKFEFKILFGFNKVVTREELAKFELYFCKLVDAFNEKNYNLSTNTLTIDRNLCSIGGKIGGRIAKEKGQIQELHKYSPLNELGRRQGLKNKLSGQVSRLGKIQGNLNKINGVLQRAWKNSQLACSKEWFVKYKDNKEFKIVNLNKFCRENNLNSSMMCEVAKNKYIKHRGWKVRTPSGVYSEDRRRGGKYVIIKDSKEFIITNLTKFLEENKISTTSAYRNINDLREDVNGFKIRKWKCKIEDIEI